MAYPQGTKITKANLLSEYNSLVITSRNGLIVWSNDSAATDPFDPQNSYGTLTSGDANPLGPSGTSGLGAGDLNDKITASNIYTAFKDRTEIASRIRTIRLIKYLNRTGFTDGSTNGDVSQFDQTNVSSMSSSYGSSYTTADFTTEPATSNKITAAGLDTFISELSAKVTANKDLTTLVFSEYYCHSSCHGSCHSSRGRR